VTVGAGTVIERSTIQDSLIGEHTHIHGAYLNGSMIGSHAKVIQKASDLSLGDFCEMQ